MRPLLAAFVFLVCASASAPLLAEPPSSSPAVPASSEIELP
jgi:hypothetical protein